MSLIQDHITQLSNTLEYGIVNSNILDLDISYKIANKEGPVLPAFFLFFYNTNHEKIINTYPLLS